jgi:hypothetical protein
MLQRSVGNLLGTFNNEGILIRLEDSFGNDIARLANWNTAGTGLLGPDGTPETARTAHAAEHAAMNSEVTASRSLTLADSGKVLKCTHATVAIVLTIEADANPDSGWSANEAVAAYQGGAAAVSFAAGDGVTLRGTAPTAAQYSTQAVHRVGANEWAYL